MRGFRARHAFDGEHELPDGELVLVGDDGLIAGVQPGGAPAPDGVEVVEFDGATLLPGLIDAHVHLCGDGSLRALDQLPELGGERLEEVVTASLDCTLAVGVTTVRDLGDFEFFVVERRSRPGEPRVLAAGPPLTTVGGHCWNMGGEVTGETELRAAVRQRAERGADVVKIMASGGVMTPGTDILAAQFGVAELSAVVDEAHRAGLPVTAHAHAMAAFEHAVAAGVDGIEHASCMVAGGPALPSEPVLAAVRERGVRLCPTPGVNPAMPEPPPRVQAIMDATGFTHEKLAVHAGRLHAAGVQLMVGADSGINPSKPHGVFPEAVGDLVRGGLTPAEALAVATSGNADGLGLGSVCGRLRPRLAADLLFVDGDPLASVTALRDVRCVVLGGSVMTGRA